MRPINSLLFLLAIGSATPSCPHQLSLSWDLLATSSTRQFRGLSVLSPSTAWVAGSSGTVLVTTDSGTAWSSVGPEPLPGENATSLLFRDVQAFSPSHAVVLSIGEGNASRIYTTLDGGASWTLAFLNAEPTAFYDCLAFDTPTHGLTVSDPVDGAFRLIETTDGGISWNILSSANNSSFKPPIAQTGEFAFAASGTCLTTTAGRWYLATGGVDPARIFRSPDARTWDAAASAVAGGESAGVYSVQFRDARHGVAVGGDYTVTNASANSAAWSEDGGATWHPAEVFPGGYRSGSTWVPGLNGVVLAVGPSGSDVSLDGGRTWRRFDNGSFDSVECVDGPACWASGPNGRVARLKIEA